MTNRSNGCEQRCYPFLAVNLVANLADLVRRDKNKEMPQNDLSNLVNGEKKPKWSLSQPGNGVGNDLADLVRKKVKLFTRSYQVDVV
jgi:hypothetical protein